VETICSFAPDVLLLEKTLPGAARELLLQRDITVVQNVKLRTMERLSRCMNVPVRALRCRKCTGVRQLIHGWYGK
jgi:hypothetical protein